MPALNFQKQFVQLVESGAKRQTIRANRQRPFRQGDVLYLYTGMRTTVCRKLGTVTATRVRPIAISRAGVVMEGDALSIEAAVALAQADGFATFGEFVGYFEKTHDLPFHGQLIEW